jgi:hypothetical protein
MTSKSKAEIEEINERERLEAERLATLAQIRRILDQVHSYARDDVIDDIADRLIEEHQQEERRRGVPDLARCELASKTEARLQALTAISQLERSPEHEVEIADCRAQFEALAREIGFRPLVHHSGLEAFVDTARAGRRMREPAAWDPAIAMFEASRSMFVKEDFPELHTKRETTAAVERLLFIRAGLSELPEDDLIRNRLCEFEDAGVVGRQRRSGGHRGLSFREYLSWAVTEKEAQSSTSQASTEVQSPDRRAASCERYIDRILIERAAVPLRLLTPAPHPLAREYSDVEQEVLLRRLREKVDQNAALAQDAAARLRVACADRLREHAEQVRRDDPAANAVPTECQSIHFGLALLLGDRLRPYVDHMMGVSADFARRTRGLGGQLELALLILLAEDPDFVEVEWGFDRLGAWDSGMVKRCRSEWELRGEELTAHRSSIWIFATWGFSYDPDAKEPPRSVIWFAAEKVCQRLEHLVAPVSDVVNAGESNEERQAGAPPQNGDTHGASTLTLVDAASGSVQQPQEDRTRAQLHGVWFGKWSDIVEDAPPEEPVRAVNAVQPSPVGRGRAQLMAVRFGAWSDPDDDPSPIDAVVEETTPCGLEYDSRDAAARARRLQFLRERGLRKDHLDTVEKALEYIEDLEGEVVGSGDLKEVWVPLQTILKYLRKRPDAVLSEANDVVRLMRAHVLWFLVEKWWPRNKKKRDTRPDGLPPGQPKRS